MSWYPPRYTTRREYMERVVRIHIQKLPEGVYLATSESVQGLVAQGRTVAETLEIARDVARRLLEAQAERLEKSSLPPAEEVVEFPVVVNI
jgi:predicted RNase H-like HicB family nuclease